MTLENKIRQILKDELKPENITTIIHMTEFLKFKESENIWSEINKLEHEYMSEEETKRLEELKLQGEFINQDSLLKELEISQDEI
ncbi:MAG TPA: hypothetical protein GX707_08175 [Epulopiscium sp.]|nr:hypothetical protein [Candidatus Epulonipiscium sp.]